MFSSTAVFTSQCASRVFVSPIKAPALMILEELRRLARHLYERVS